MATYTEEISVAGGKLKSTLKSIIKEGNVRRVMIQNSSGRTLIDLPLTAGVVGTHGPLDSTIAAPTDGEGAFRFALPVSATSALVVRRRGFADARVTLDADVPSKRSVTLPAISMAPSVAPLVSVVVPDTGAY